jgi:hypothetical protein
MLVAKPIRAAIIFFFFTSQAMPPMVAPVVRERSNLRGREMTL